MSRKKFNIICFVVIFFMGLLIQSISYLAGNGNSENRIEGILTSLFIKSFIVIEKILLYVYGVEMFDGQMRGTACGFSMCIGMYSSLFGQSLYNYFRYQLELSSMLGCSLISVIVFPFLFYLPETILKKVN